MPKPHNKNLQSRILLSGVGLLVTLIASQVILQIQFFSQDNKSKVINLAGRQRMLSQRLAKNFTLLSHTENSEEKELYIKKMKADWSELKEMHQKLSLGSPHEQIEPAFTKEILLQYKSLNVDFAEMEKSLSCGFNPCPQIQNELSQYINSSDRFLVKMDKIVLNSEKFSRNEMKTLEMVHLILFTLIALLIVFIFYRVILPTFKKIGKQNIQLLDQDKLLEKIEETAKIGGWTLNLYTQNMTWSLGLYRLFDSSPVKSKKISDMLNYFSHEDQNRILQYLDLCQRQQIGFDDEFELVTENGVKKWVRLFAKEPSIQDDHKTLVISGAIQDITKRKYAELEVIESQRYLELAMEGAGLGIWDWFLNDNSVHFDQRWAEMLGIDYNHIEMKLSTWESRVHPDDIKKCYEDIQQYLDGKTPYYENIHRMKHENGSWVYILDRGRISEWDKQGRPFRFTGTHLDVTDFKKLQEEQNFILASTEVGIWKWDIVQDKIVWDENSGKLFEFEPNTSSSSFSDWEKKLHKDYKKETLDKIQEVLQKHTDLDITFAIVTSNQQTKYIGTRAQLERNDKGEAIKMYGLSWDQTQEKQSEFEMRNYVRAIDSYAIVAETNRTGIITDVNKKFVEVSKYSKDELIGSTHRIINSGYHSKEFFKEFWETINSGQTWRGIIKNKAKDGAEYWVDSTITPKMDEKGNINGFMAFRYDITELKNAQFELEEALRLEKVNNHILDISNMEIPLKEKLDESLKTILQIDWLAIQNQGGIFLKKNENQIELVSEQNLSTPLLSICKVVNFNHCLCGRAASLKKLLHASCVDERHDNSFSGMKAHGHYNVPILDNDQLLGVMVFYIEHGHKRSELEVRSLTSISKAVAQLILKAQKQEELQKQKQFAQHNAKLASIGVLASGVGHEINNPLAIVKGHILSLKKKIKNPDFTNEQLVEQLDKMNIATTRIANIVQGLRNFSRVDNQQFEPFNIYQVMKESNDMVESIYSGEGVHIEFNPLKDENKNIFINGNRGKIQQVIMNLLANAKDATEGQPSRKIILSSDYQDGKFIVKVQDNGAGIPADSLEKIFDAFYTTKEVNKGTGLGLSLVHGIIGDHKGQIFVETQMGSGSTFTVELPAYINEPKSSGDILSA